MEAPNRNGPITVVNFQRQNPFVVDNEGDPIRPRDELVTRADRIRSTWVKGIEYASFALPVGVACVLAPKAFLIAAVTGIAIGIFLGWEMQSGHPTNPADLTAQGYYKTDNTTKSKWHLNIDYFREWRDYLQQRAANQKIITVKVAMNSFVIMPAAALILYKFSDLYIPYKVPQILGVWAGFKVGYNAGRFTKQCVTSLAQAQLNRVFR